MYAYKDLLNVIIKIRTRALLILQSDPRKAENFDSQFKKLPMGKTPPDKTAEYIISNLKGDEFKGFSFLNTEFQITHVSSLW